MASDTDGAAPRASSLDLNTSLSWQRASRKANRAPNRFARAAASARQGEAEKVASKMTPRPDSSTAADRRNVST